MNPTDPLPGKVDRTAVSVSESLDEGSDKAYWLSRTPEERLRHMELLRRLNYGEAATGRLQRILEYVERYPRGNSMKDNNDMKNRS